MRAHEVFQATRCRIRRPMTWGAILAFGLLWNLARWALGILSSHPEDWLAPFGWATLFLVLAPVPWQWTGEDAPLARPWRGLLQALPWNALWVTGLMLLIWLPSRGPASLGPPRRPRPEAQGATAMPNPPPEPRPEPPPFRIPGRVLYYALANLSSALLLGWILADKERAEAQAGIARKAAAEAQAQALQSQMSPHVLFNALGGITELVREDAAAAEEALVNLADLLRGILDHGSRSRAPLAAERVLVERYLALEAIRLGRRLRLEWDWDASLEGAFVPPLLLQPLVENAIKHGIAPNRGGGELRIALRRAGEGLELEVSNTGEPFVDGRPEGVGLRNLRARLDLLGLSSGAFELGQVEGRTRARLRFSREEGA